MANFKSPDARASETVTFRLTLDERRLLDHLAGLAQVTLTDLLRDMLRAEANRMGVASVPDKVPRRRRGRPKKEKPALQEPRIEELEYGVKALGPARFVEPEPGRDEEIPLPLYRSLSRGESSGRKEATFGDIVARFREHFSKRAEGTRRELEETIRFLTSPQGEGTEALLPLETTYEELTFERLKSMREEMKALPIRVAKKNLHLTYLRMMLHWAVKEPDIGLELNPAVQLKSFTLKELEGQWPRF